MVVVTEDHTSHTDSIDEYIANETVIWHMCEIVVEAAYDYIIDARFLKQKQFFGQRVEQYDGVIRSQNLSWMRSERNDDTLSSLLLSTPLDSLKQLPVAEVHPVIRADRNNRTLKAFKASIRIDNSHNKSNVVIIIIFFHKVGDFFE